MLSTKKILKIFEAIDMIKLIIAMINYAKIRLFVTNCKDDNIEKCIICTSR